MANTYVSIFISVTHILYLFFFFLIDAATPEFYPLPHHDALPIWVRPPQALRTAGSFSGGNQQKVALAKWLTYPPKVLVLSEPTRGMDVGAKAEVLKTIRDLK